MLTCIISFFLSIHHFLNSRPHLIFEQKALEELSVSCSICGGEMMLQDSCLWRRVPTQIIFHSFHSINAAWLAGLLQWFVFCFLLNAFSKHLYNPFVKSLTELVIEYDFVPKSSPTTHNNIPSLVQVMENAALFSHWLLLWNNCIVWIDVIGK